MPLRLSAILLAGALGASNAFAQDAPAVEPALVAAPAANSWQEVAASAAKTYLADTANIGDADGAKIVQVAVVSRTGSAGDYSHMVNQYAIRCAANQFQVAVETSYGATGAEEDRFADDAAPWDPIRPGSLAEGLKELACDGGSSTGMPYATIRAFIDGGRQ